MNAEQSVALRALQRQFAAAVRHPARVPSAAFRSRIARRGTARRSRPPFSADARIGVYAHAYLARLVDVLAGDYGALRTWLGGDAFTALARRYLGAHPSRHPNLNRLGARLPAFLRRTGAARFACELARLELALTEAFDAPEFTPLPADALAALPPSRWARLRLVPNPSVRLLRLPAAVFDFHGAWREGRAVPAPRSGVIDLCVFRTDDRLGSRVLPRDAGRLLRALARGESLATAVGRLPTGSPVDAWFAQWRADGVFGAVG